MRVALLTLGCRVNQSESSVLEGTLKENGITIVDLKDNPDYCIINTCTVTARSDYNSRQLIRRAARAGAKVIVTGCYSQLRPEEIRGLPGVVEIVDSKNKYEIIYRFAGKSAALFFGNSSHSRPYLKIQDGCNFNCSYCAVPLARGRSGSVPLKEVIARVLALDSKGYNEIVLTGIHLGAYGHDLVEKTTLKHLLRKILQETGIYRIRLSSLEINEADDELIEIMQDDRICKHLHLPLQSGSEKILGLMDRHYTAEHFRKKVEAVGKRADNFAIGTDIIVGFPEEGENDFTDTFNLVRELPLTYLHVFPFSPRPGTRAASMKSRPSSGVVKKRMEKIMDLGKLKKNEYMQRQLGGLLEIILEERLNEGTAAGTSGNYLKVEVSVKDYLKGSVMRVRPESLENGILRGVVAV